MKLEVIVYLYMKTIRLSKQFMFMNWYTSNSGISIKFIDNREGVNNTGFINLTNLEFFPG